MSIVDQVLNYGAAIAAIAAAAFWWRSAAIETPSTFPIVVTSSHTLLEKVAGSEIPSQGSSPELDAIGLALIQQSRESGRGAIAAAAAALLQALALLPWT